LLDCSHKQIHLKWIYDLNNDSAILSFVYHGEKIHVEHKGRPVDRELWASLIEKVKSECTSELSASPCLIVVMSTSYLLVFLKLS